MKKKMLAAVFSALLIFTMSVSLFACGGNGNEDNGDNEKPASFQDENNREFVGWTLRDEEVFYEPGQTFTMPAKFVIFVAKWKATSIDVVYYDDTTAESEVYAKQNYGFDDSVVLPEPPQKKGFTFGGWGTYLSTEANFTADYVFTQSDKEAGKIEVFALWIPNDDGDEETPA